MSTTLPKVKKVIQAIDDWAKVEFPDAHFRQYEGRKNYQYGGVVSINRIWKTNEGTVVDATIQYMGRTAALEMRDVLFQLDDVGVIVGWDALSRNQG